MSCNTRIGKFFRCGGHNVAGQRILCDVCEDKQLRRYGDIDPDFSLPSRNSLNRRRDEEEWTDPVQPIVQLLLNDEDLVELERRKRYDG